MSTHREHIAENRYLRLLLDEAIEALRSAPTPFRESVLGDDDWDEAYYEWWSTHSQESALEKFEKPFAYDGS